MKYSSARTAPRIDIGAKHGSDKEVVVFVRDNGVGFDMQYAHKLFGVFQRLHGSDELSAGIGAQPIDRTVATDERHGSMHDGVVFRYRTAQLARRAIAWSPVFC